MEMAGPASAESAGFGALLKRYRLAAGFSQEELAERARLSARAISAYERGQRQAPYRDTVGLLVRALGLSPEEAATLEAAVPRRRGPAAAPVVAEVATGTAEARPDTSPHATTARADLGAPQAPRHNLPVPATSYVGREREQAAVLGLLERSRLVTLTGAGGAGKTRLLLQVAAASVDTYPDGVWLVELASLAGPALVPEAVAAVVGVREEPGRPLPATLAAYLQAKTLLLLLDNCEHLIAACAELATTLLRICSHLHMLASSREGLQVAGETTFRVPSLSVPDLNHLPAPERLAGYEAVQLFRVRAQAHRTEFSLTAANARAVAQICARLDGMPLAIELAAARVSVLPVEGIAARLDDCFRLLTGGPRTALPRQQTLRATLDWSHALLSEPEQVLLRRLSVFAGGWTLGAAEAVCAGKEVAAWEMLDLLEGLINKSLVVLDDPAAGGSAGEARYRLLETVRQYGQERLEASGEASAVREQHLDWCVALAEQTEPEPRLWGPEHAHWLDQLEAEHANLIAALGWARERGEGERGLQLAGALWRFWGTRGYPSEGRGWLEWSLATHGGTAALRARALYGAGYLTEDQGDYLRARALLEESLALFRGLGDKRGMGRALIDLGAVAGQQGDYPRARALLEESLALFRELGDKWGMGRTLVNLGWQIGEQEDYAEAQVRGEQSLTLFRELGHDLGIAHAHILLGQAALGLGDYIECRAQCEEGLARCRKLGDKWGIGCALAHLATVALERSDYPEARTRYEESLDVRHEAGEKREIAACLEGLAEVAAAQGRSERAAVLCGAAEALRDAIGAPLPPIGRARYARGRDAARAELGEEGFALAWARGQTMSPEQAIALALQSLDGIANGSLAASAAALHD